MRWPWGGDVPRTKFANDAIAYTFKTYFTDKALSYRYPEEVPFKEGILEVLQKMGAVVKICSGLPLAGAKKIAFVESLGLTAADYIFAGKKAEGISQFIAADYAAQKQAGGEVNQTYVAVLMDNLGGGCPKPPIVGDRQVYSSDGCSCCGITRRSSCGTSSYL